MTSHSANFPEETAAALSVALRQCIGSDNIQDVQPLAHSRTAQVFRISVQGTHYLLRLISDRISEDNCLGQLQAMQAAAAAGLSPRVHYASLQDRISITNFVTAVPLSREQALERLPEVLQQLHALPPLPDRDCSLHTCCTFLLHSGPARDAFFQRAEAAKLVPHDQFRAAQDLCIQIAEACPPLSADMVFSHNDLVRPGNILFDGDRIWLIDWEAAFRNDRYADLAVLANFLVHDATQEDAFLEAYFGHPPSRYQRARLRLMQQVAHVFYGLVYLLLGSSATPVNRSEPAPDFDDFHLRLWTRELETDTPEARLHYGKAHWQRLLITMQEGRFQDSLDNLAHPAQPDA